MRRQEPLQDSHCIPALEAGRSALVSTLGVRSGNDEDAWAAVDTSMTYELLGRDDVEWKMMIYALLGWRPHAEVMLIHDLLIAL